VWVGWVGACGGERASGPVPCRVPSQAAAGTSLLQWAAASEANPGGPSGWAAVGFRPQGDERLLCGPAGRQRASAAHDVDACVLVA
jgi:hypothetical protein